MNGVRSATWELVRVGPTAAELAGVVRWSDGPPAGRLTGPRCRYAATVEVAYPLRFGEPTTDGSGLRADFRVVVPEPNPWHPDAPFFYDLRVGDITLPIGLRTRSVTPAGILWNGRPLETRVSRSEPSATVAELRMLGFRAMAVSPAVVHTWNDADTFGMAVVGVLPADVAEWPAIVAELGARACLFGWLAPADVPEAATLAAAGHLVSMEGAAVPAWASFVVGEDGRVRAAGVTPLSQS